MPCHAFTRYGLLLLVRGERIASSTQLDRLLRADVVFSDEPPESLARPVKQRQRDLGIRTGWLYDAEDDEEYLLEPSGEAPEQKAETIEPTAPFVGEVVAARSLRHAAMDQVARLNEQVQSGEPIDVGAARNTVGAILESLQRNERAFASLLRLRSLDTYTFTHSLNTSVLAIMLARRSGFVEEMEEIGVGGLLHDIGKARLPAELLRKEGSLTPTEWDLMHQHPSLGVDIATRAKGLPGRSLQAISQHHERLDGSGYPAHLSGINISPAGRIVAIADVYDAMTSDRPYRHAIQPPDVMRELSREAGELLDRRLVSAFISAVGLFPIGSLVRLDSGELAVVAKINPQAVRKPVVLVIGDINEIRTDKPRPLDLARQPTPDTGRKIVGMEDAATLGIDVDECLTTGIEAVVGAASDVDALA